MSSSNNDYGNGNMNGVYPLSLYLSSLSGRHGIFHNPYNPHQLTASPGQMVSAVPESPINYMAFNSNNAVNQQDFEVSREVKKAVKKDRHSKIRTAQGLRDRRVRLSIDIARQFFDLQDILGFDKASKTLDWLLKKSRNAIDELVQEKKLNNDDEDFVGNNEGGVEEEKEDDDGETSFGYGSSPEDCEEEVVCEVKKTEKRKKKSELSSISSKESRDKAKEKAKEISSKMTYDHPETVSQSENMNPFKRSMVFNEREEITHPFYKQQIQEFDNQESILSKTKMNLETIMSQSYNQQQGKFMLMDQGSSSNYSSILPQNLDFEYDQNPFIHQPFCDTNFPRGFP